MLCLLVSYGRLPLVGVWPLKGSGVIVPDCELERIEEDGESPMGEKYELTALSSGVPGVKLVETLSEGGFMAE